MTDQNKTETKPSTFLVFSSDDGGSTLTRRGKVEARSADEAVRKHVVGIGPVSETTEFGQFAAISENYFKLRQPKPKVVTSITFDDVDWDSSNPPPEPSVTVVVSPEPSGIA